MRVLALRAAGVAMSASILAASLLASTYTVTTAADAGAGSLRQAILDANVAADADTIQFNIPGAGVHTITPLTDFPMITGPVTIDGYTQPGSSANTNGPGLPDNSVHLIELDGTNTYPGNGGFVIGFQGSFAFTLRGLVINRARASGVQVNSASGTIEGCFIGTDAAGIGALPNYEGVDVEGSPGVQFGGLLPAQRNVISANAGVQIGFGCYSAGGTGHVIQGNFIGPDSTGAAVPLPHAAGTNNGIAFCYNVTNVTIGGATDAARNVISGNSFVGVNISSSYCVNCVTGIVVRGNYIGTDVTGTLPLGNGYGVSMVTIGNDVLDNVISGNLSDAVIVGSGDPADGALVQGNLIGTDASGALPLPNVGWGVHVIAGGVQVGGTAAGEANTIAYNGTGFSGGILVEGSQGGNSIRANSVHDNAGLGIDLSPVGTTANDELDADAGTNGLQNFPVLAAVTLVAPAGEAPSGGTHVQGFLHSAPSSSYTLDFFSNDACVRFPKDFLEGRTYLGSAPVTTDGAGEGPFDVTLPVSIAPGERVSMTATDAAGSTSEFSQRLPFSILPASGPSAGGTAVTIAGTDLEDGATVSIGGQPATNVVVTSFNQITATSPALGAGSLNDVVVVNTEGTRGTLEKGWVADFLDVAPGNQFYSFVTTLVSNAITAGVGGGAYGVDAPTLRQQMAVFLLKGKHGLCYAPPPCAGTFPDVPCPSTFAAWIEALAAEGITGGCGSGNYCPQSPVRRDQMAVFLLKAEHGSSYLPPACAGAFPDVACPSTFADWIERLAAEQITGGCGNGNYCPLANNTRGQMAAFITKTFQLQ